MGTSKAWSEADVPPLDGRTYVVTGSNSGIGWEAARALAAKGARVVMACRTPSKAEQAATRLRGVVPGAKLDVMRLDLASLASVRAFATELLAKHERIDGLVNNAGLMALPPQKTADGFEMQLGTNHLGHFALTGLLWDRLRESGTAERRARVVNVASHAHRMGKMHWDDLQLERRYDRWKAYGQSKLANLLFTFELDRRARAKGAPVASLACHPGYAATELQLKGSQMDGGSRFDGMLMKFGNGIIAQDAAGGALPTLRAATDPSAESGTYFGPRGMFEMAGPPVPVGTTRLARDEAEAKRLWDESVRLTSVDFGGL